MRRQSAKVEQAISDGENPYKPLEEVADELSPLADETPLPPVTPLDPMFAGFIASVASGSIVGGVATFLSSGFRVTPTGLFGGMVVSLIVGAISFGVGGAISVRLQTDVAKLVTSTLAGAAAGWTVGSYVGLPFVGSLFAVVFCATVVLLTVRRNLEKQKRSEHSVLK